MLQMRILGHYARPIELKLWAGAGGGGWYGKCVLTSLPEDSDNVSLKNTAALPPVTESMRLKEMVWVYPDSPGT